MAHPESMAYRTIPAAADEHDGRFFEFNEPIEESPCSTKEL